MTAAFHHELPFGASLIGRDRTRFRLYAPGEPSLVLEIEGREPIAMVRGDDGWFAVEAACGAGARYHYRLADGRSVPDPAARAQADDVHGPSVVIDPGAYQWRNAGWLGRPWRESILYEVHCGTMGGFGGVRRTLPRLADLGITAVELMPVNDSPGKRNWGYDGVLPFAPAASYGVPDDLKALVDAAHGLGLMMFLDVVYNHFGPDGNYLASYAPNMFRNDIATPWGAAIDFLRPEVRRFFTENALFWLMEYRFDGLRFDAVHAIGQPDWLDEMAGTVRAAVEPGRQVHLVLEHDGNQASHLRRDFDAQWNDDAHHVLHVLLTGEREGYYADYVDDPAKRLARCLAQGFIYQGEASVHRGGVPRGSRSVDLPPTAFVLFLQNHDQVGNRAFGERLTALVGSAALEAAITLQMLAPQIPLLFMGEEDASTTPFLYFTDHHDQLADAVRDGRRREFAKFAAFADAARRELIPDPNAQATFERSIPRPDPGCGAARFDLYRRLIAVRHAEVVPRLAGARSIAARALGPASVIAHWRMGDAAVLTIASNLGADPVALQPPRGRLLFESTRDAGARVQAGRVPAWATVALLEAPDER
jgi:maltooligosyltrehalose trehalohydrolase